MGKKIKIVASDPILSNNYKFEKRVKDRLLERAKGHEERAEEQRHKKVMAEVEGKVDSQIQQVTSSLEVLVKTTQIDKLKSQLLTKRGRRDGQPKKGSKVAELSLSTMGSLIDSYQYHFGLGVEEGQVVQQQQNNTGNHKIQQETHLQINRMLGVVEDQKGNPEQPVIQTNQIFNLSIDCKKQSQVRIGHQLFLATTNFSKNQRALCQSSEKSGDNSLDVAKLMINSYFDHVFIENSQEQKIESFRHIVLDHAVAHLSRSLSQEKGKGFTNCKVLILTPFFGDARAIMDLIELKLPEYQVNNKEKMDQFDDQNDFFRIGIKMSSKKKQLKYFNHFDHSEIIVASPVGLKSIIGSEGDQKRENSFISSVEILYVDRASALLMQNWSHLSQVLHKANIMPHYQSLKNSIEAIRESFLKLRGRLYRQSIAFSEFNFPELNSLKRVHFHNLQGCTTSKIIYHKPSVDSPFEQQFFKVDVKEPRDDLEIRFSYFKRKFWDDLHNKQSLSKVVLFTQSYLQFVRLRTFLQRANASAECICQHTSKGKVQSRLARFNNDHFRILLITERAFYFQVCQIQRFYSLYFYSLPRNCFIYEQLLGSLVADKNGSNRVISIYTRFDLLVVERMVGTSKAIQMIQQYCNNVSFVV